MAVGTLGITPEHDALAQSVADFAAGRGLTAAARVQLDAPTEGRPPFWQELAEQGLLGLHLPEEHGGSAAGAVELAVVAEQLGRALAPGPFVPTVLASLLLARTDAPVGKELLAGLADGSLRATVALDGALLDTPAGLTGTLGPVVSGAVADVVLVRAASGWQAVRVAAGGVQARELPSADATRRVAELRFDGAAGAELPGISDGLVAAAAAVLYSAEACGLAGYGLETATAYAKVREQFGRPIGTFQGVKHLCADLLVRVEVARALVWDAARALDDGFAVDLAADLALSAAVEAAVGNTKDCVQILGGIGYTWEHDAHLALKRAVSLRSLLGDPAAARVRAARLARGGARRPLDLELGPEAEPYRAQVREFLVGLASISDPRERRVAIADSGYLVPHYPKPYGRDADPVEQLVVDEEFRHAGVTRPDLIIGAWCLPTVLAHGDEAQRERFARPTFYGDLSWCQLFSEPGAGSDLASLATKAEKVEGGWRINGQKVWTSNARNAHVGLLLARTTSIADLAQAGAKRHDGITCFVLDMTSPGVDIRPLREITGHALFNEVFFDNVFIPDDMQVGEVGGGWRLARATLANERVAMSRGSSLGAGVEAALAALGADPGELALERAGRLVCEGSGLALLGFRTTLRQLAGADPGAAASVRKLVGTPHQQEVTEFLLELAGPAGLSRDGDLAGVHHGFLNSRCLTIAGGTTQVLKNVAAERILGLPRDPEPLRGR